MTIQEMKSRKRELGYSNEQVAALSGVPLSTVQKIFGGSTQSPRYDTLLKLERILRRGDAGASPNIETVYKTVYTSTPAGTSVIREPGAAYHAEKKQGTYTLDDYYALPEEQRAELIDGVIYDMGAPTTVHQHVLGEVFYRFRAYVKENKGQCKVYAAPTDVQLDCDDRTMVQPDLMVLCDRKKLLRRCIFGAPDFVLEILSPSTRRKDITIKSGKYAAAGVREYWIIDPDREKILVFDFEHDDFPVIYTFDDQVPVKIWEDRFCINFPEIRDELREIYGSLEE